VSAGGATARGAVGRVASAGRLVKVNVLGLPALPPGARAVSLAGGTPVSEFGSFAGGETVVGLASVDAPGAGVALGTAEGVVKRVLPEYPQNRDGVVNEWLRRGPADLSQTGWSGSFYTPRAIVDVLVARAIDHWCGVDDVEAAKDLGVSACVSKTDLAGVPSAVRAAVD